MPSCPHCHRPVAAASMLQDCDEILHLSALKSRAAQKTYAEEAGFRLDRRPEPKPAGEERPR